MPQVNKKIVLALGGALAFYFLITLFRFSFTPFWTSPDGYWYHKIARNWAQGRGWVETSILYYYPAPESVTHPASSVWNPLSYWILGFNYKLFGISDFSARLPILILDALLLAAIFMFCLKVHEDLAVAAFASFIFAAHKFILAIRASGGAAEGFHSFFMTLFCMSLGLAFEKDLYFYLAAFLAGLAYLVRNESLWGIVVLIVVFLIKRRSAGVEEKTPWTVPAFSLLIFLAVIVPWEWRNHALYGAAANWSKYALIFGRDYYDLWTTHLKPEGLLWFIQYHLGMGWKALVTVKVQSLYYKLDSAVNIIGWPIVSLLLLGIAANFRRKVYWPAGLYFCLTYALMGVLNSASQGSGWHAPNTLLPVLICLAVSGAFSFGTMITQDPNKARAMGSLICILLLFYHLADIGKQYRLLQKVGFKNPIEAYASEVKDCLIAQGADPSRTVVMAHIPQYINFYADIPTIQIPTNEPKEEVWRVMKKYGCEYLVLTGSLPAVFSGLYHGTEEVPSARLVCEKAVPGLPIEGAGGRFKIYKVES